MTTDWREVEGQGKGNTIRKPTGGQTNSINAKAASIHYISTLGFKP
jgi:hypothetical protein